MITVHHLNNSRSLRVLWLLHPAGRRPHGGALKRLSSKFSSSV
jgi:hypothetical protein